MTESRLLLIVRFSEQECRLSNEWLGINEATLKMVLFVMRRHLEGKLVTVTTLAQAADIPYTTAVRRIDHMLDEGLLVKRPRTSTGKSFALHPSAELVSRFDTYARSIERLLTAGSEDAGGPPGHLFDTPHPPVPGLRPRDAYTRLAGAARLIPVKRQPLRPTLRGRAGPATSGPRTTPVSL